MDGCILSAKIPPKCLRYNGLGQRVSQTVSSVVTEYLLDVQPGLWKVIAADDGTDVNRYIHDPVTGRILQHEDPSNNWNWPALDGLGTVRGVYDDTLTEVYAADRDPYGGPIASTGSNPTPFEYTGEPEDQNGLLHLRARYYDPGLAVFNSRDPLETANRYAYVGGNPIGRIDPSGLDYVPPTPSGSCSNEDSPCSPDPFTYCTQQHINGAPGSAEIEAFSACMRECNAPPPPRTDTECSRFVSDVRSFIDGVKEARRESLLLWLATSESDLVIDFLAAYFSGIPFNARSFYLGPASIPLGSQGVPGEDRYRVPEYEVPQSEEVLYHDWRHPINDRRDPQGQQFRDSYGFRRPYFQNTHHYFAYLKVAYHGGEIGARYHNSSTELNDQVIPAYDLWQNPPSDLSRLTAEEQFERYEWFYREAVYDLYIVEEAIDFARIIRWQGIDSLPSLLEQKWCAQNEEDVWALESVVDMYQNSFPEEYQPWNLR